MNIKRITSSVVIAIALIVILLMPSKLITGILFTAISIVAMYEYLKAVSKKCNPVKWVAYASCILVLIPALFATKYDKLERKSIIESPITETSIESDIINLFDKSDYDKIENEKHLEELKVYGYTIASIVMVLFLHVIFSNMKTNFKDIVYTLFGICYIPGFWMFMTLINNLPYGKILLGYVFISAWGTDTFAYSIGSRLGKHRFSKVSPSKSLEGCISGTVGAILLAILLTFILNRFYEFDISYIAMSFITLVLSIIGQLGDFSASSIKRYVDIKDYGTLLPGHGGMLDRIDSVLFIAPFAYMIFSVL